VIMASDGLWDHMSSEQAVKLVEMWMIARENRSIGRAALKSTAPAGMKGLQDAQKVREENFVVEVRTIDSLISHVSLQIPVCSHYSISSRYFPTQYESLHLLLKLHLRENN
jgi:hypothetical protein